MVVRTAEQILRDAKTIAVVGASPNPAKPSHGVANYLERVGYRVLRVNPLCEEFWPSLASLEEAVDLVDVFRRPEFCADVAREAAAVGAPAVWLQLGIRSQEARIVAEASGMDYVEDACTAVVHRNLG
jgi:predicted CoA-binding protein